jgi:hypothetical protein
MNCLKRFHPSSFCSHRCNSFILLHRADRPRDFLDYLPADTTVYSSPFRMRHMTTSFCWISTFAEAKMAHWIRKYTENWLIQIFVWMWVHTTTQPMSILCCPPKYTWLVYIIHVTFSTPTGLVQVLLSLPFPQLWLANVLEIILHTENIPSPKFLHLPQPNSVTQKMKATHLLWKGRTNTLYYIA